MMVGSGFPLSLGGNIFTSEPDQTAAHLPMDFWSGGSGVSGDGVCRSAEPVTEHVGSVAALINVAEGTPRQRAGQTKTPASLGLTGGR